MQTTKTIDRTCKSHNPEGRYLEKATEIGEIPNPEKPADAKGVKMALRLSSLFSVHKGASSLNVYVLSIYIVITLVILGMWRCPSLIASYG